MFICYYVSFKLSLRSVYFITIRETTVDVTVIKHVLLQHQHRVIRPVSDQNIQRIHVRRNNIFADALRQFSKQAFDVSKTLRVRFVGEAAVDEGGPRREFFHLLMQDTFKSALFAGYPNHTVPLHNVEAVSNNTYFFVGKMIATCVIQGGEVPACFAKAVADYLVFDQVSAAFCLDDIPDYEARMCLQKV